MAVSIWPVRAGAPMGRRADCVKARRRLGGNVVRSPIAHAEPQRRHRRWPMEASVAADCGAIISGASVRLCHGLGQQGNNHVMEQAPRNGGEPVTHDAVSIDHISDWDTLRGPEPVDGYFARQCNRVSDVLCGLAYFRAVACEIDADSDQLQALRLVDSVTGAEKLGAAVLADDDEAVAFAKRVIRELIHRDAKLYATWMMEITAGKRSVASVPFESDAMEDGAGGV
jgi:hypothetical protein